MTFRVSWMAYVRPIIVMLLGSAISFFMIYNTTFGRLKLIDDWGLVDEMTTLDDARSMVSVIAFALVIIVLWRLTRKILNLLSLWTMRLRVSDKHVSYSQGILPWNRFSRYWEDYQVYEALYSTPDRFLGWLFNYGNLHIVGQEGSTQQYTIYFLGNVRTACDMINAVASRAGRTARGLPDQDNTNAVPAGSLKTYDTQSAFKPPAASDNSTNPYA